MVTRGRSTGENMEGTILKTRETEGRTSETLKGLVLDPRCPPTASSV